MVSTMDSVLAPAELNPGDVLSAAASAQSPPRDVIDFRCELPSRQELFRTRRPFVIKKHLLKLNESSSSPRELLKTVMMDNMFRSVIPLRCRSYKESIGLRRSSPPIDASCDDMVKRDRTIQEDEMQGTAQSGVSFPVDDASWTTSVYMPWENETKQCGVLARQCGLLKSAIVNLCHGDGGLCENCLDMGYGEPARPQSWSYLDYNHFDKWIGAKSIGDGYGGRPSTTRPACPAIAELQGLCFLSQEERKKIASCRTSSSSGPPASLFENLDLPVLWVGEFLSSTRLHYDLYDANLVVQFCGTKRWVLVGPGVEEVEETRLPFEESTVFAAGKEGDSIKDATTAGALIVDLEPGDLLFVPAGWWHATQALSKRAVSVNQFLGLGNALASARLEAEEAITRVVMDGRDGSAVMLLLWRDICICWR